MDKARTMHFRGLANRGLLTKQDCDEMLTSLEILIDQNPLNPTMLKKAVPGTGCWIRIGGWEDERSHASIQVGAFQAWDVNNTAIVISSSGFVYRVGSDDICFADKNPWKVDAKTETPPV